jgi:hypothetical protein
VWQVRRTKQLWRWRGGSEIVRNVISLQKQEIISSILLVAMAVKATSIIIEF